MEAYLSAAKQIISKFGTVKVAQVGRAQNRHADSLATLASSTIEEIPRLIKVELIREPSIGMEDNCNPVGVEVAMVSITDPCWMNLIIDFLAEDKVLDDEKEAKNSSSGSLVLVVGKSQIVPEVFRRLVPFMLTSRKSK